MPLCLAVPCSLAYFRRFCARLGMGLTLGRVVANVGNMAFALWFDAEDVTYVIALAAVAFAWYEQHHGESATSGRVMASALCCLLLLHDRCFPSGRLS
eukprot:5061412-Amphidinium_carterae.1